MNNAMSRLLKSLLYFRIVFSVIVTVALGVFIYLKNFQAKSKITDVERKISFPLMIKTTLFYFFLVLCSFGGLCALL